MAGKRETQQPKPYAGPLTAEQAAAAMQAARLNVLDLLDTADILFSLKRSPHSVLCSTLAIEEAGKVPLLQGIFLGFGGDRTTLWKAYRLHRAKTQMLNIGIAARARAAFAEMPSDAAKEIGQAGPSPDELEMAKQLAVYSDCLELDGEFRCHLPRSTDRRQEAWERLCEARALVHGLRDYPPEELEVWLKHARETQAKGGDFRSMLEPLHEELQAKGFIREGHWKLLMAEVREGQVQGAEEEQKGD